MWGCGAPAEHRTHDQRQRHDGVPGSSRASSSARHAGGPAAIRRVVRDAYAEYAHEMPTAMFRRYLADLLDLDRHARLGTAARRRGRRAGLWFGGVLPRCLAARASAGRAAGPAVGRSPSTATARHHGVARALMAALRGPGPRSRRPGLRLPHRAVHDRRRSRSTRRSATTGRRSTTSTWPRSSALPATTRSGSSASPSSCSDRHQPEKRHVMTQSMTPGSAAHFAAEHDVATEHEYVDVPRVRPAGDGRVAQPCGRHAAVPSSTSRSGASTGTGS